MTSRKAKVAAGLAHQRSVRSVRASIWARPGAPTPVVIFSSFYAPRAGRLCPLVPLPANTSNALVVRVEPQSPVVGCVRYHNDVGFTTLTNPRFRRGRGLGQINCIDFEAFHIVGQPAHAGGVTEVGTQGLHTVPQLAN